MRFEFFIALRHLMSRERKALISIITLISVLGVVVGVMALVAVIAVMDGADDVYRDQLINVKAHIETVALDANMASIDPMHVPPKPMGNYKEVMSIIKKDPDVVAVSPIIQNFCLLTLKAANGISSLRSSQPAQLLGIDAPLERQVTRIGEVPDVKDMKKSKKKLIGTADPESGQVVLGSELAVGLGAQIGDDIYAVTGNFATTANSTVSKQSKLRVVGIFSAGIYEIDKMYAYVNLPTAQRVFLLPDVVDGVHLRLKDPFTADKVKKRIDAALIQKLGAPFVSRSWSELSPDFFTALKLEKLGMFIILLLVIIVAGLNIISTLILVAMEKTREIGILRAMGTSRHSISRVFLMEGALIGFAGTGIGVVCGLILCWFLKYHFPIEIPAAVYGLDGLPVVVSAWTIFTICASSISICLLASVVPAVQASRLDIVEALRYE